MGTIQAAQYNALQGSVASILGQGSGSYANTPITDISQLYGYGQNVTSSRAAQYTEITAAQWAALRNDILACYYHQGLTLQLPAAPSNTIEITQADYTLYNSIVDAINLNVNRLAFPAAGQYSGTVIDSPTKTNWSGLATHTMTVNFPAYTNGQNIPVSASDCARYFFNAGGRIEITPTISGGGLDSSTPSTALDLAWKTAFNRVGTLYFNFNSTSCTNTQYTSGPSQTVYVSSGIGFNNLTTSYQSLLTSITSTDGGTYYPNRLVVNAKVNATPNPSQIIFQILYEDTSLHANEPIDSIITSTVAYTRASGSYVSVVGPTATNSSFV